MQPAAPPPRRSKREHHPTARLVAAAAASLPPSSSRRPPRRRATPTASPASTRASSPSRSLVTSPASSEASVVRVEPSGSGTHRRRMRAAAHTTTTSLVTRVYLGEQEGTGKPNGKLLDRYTSHECTLLCEVILSQMKNQTLTSTVLDEETSPASIRWEAVAKRLQTTHKLQVRPRECQQLWKFLAYGQVAEPSGDENELLPDSDEEDFHQTPRQINEKLAARRAVEAEEKRTEATKELDKSKAEAEEQTSEVREKQKTEVAETAATREQEPKTAMHTSSTEVPEAQTAEKEEAATADTPAAQTEEKKEEVEDKPEAQTAAKQETTNKAGDLDVQTAKVSDNPPSPHSSSEAATKETTDNAVTGSDVAPQRSEEVQTKLEALYPTYTLPMGAPDSWHRPFNPKKSLSLTFVASRFLKRKPQVVTQAAAAKAAVHKVPGSTTTGAVAVGVAIKPSSADLKRKLAAPVNSAVKAKKKKLEIGTRTLSPAPRVFTPSSTPPPPAQRARTQLEFFALRLGEDMAKAQDKTVLTAADVQRRFGQASLQVRRECQELATRDIDRYNRELVRVRIWEKAVGPKSAKPTPVLLQPANQKPVATAFAVNRTAGPAAALLAHAAAVSAAASKIKAAGQPTTAVSTTLAPSTQNAATTAKSAVPTPQVTMTQNVASTNKGDAAGQPLNATTTPQATPTHSSQNTKPAQK